MALKPKKAFKVKHDKYRSAVEFNVRLTRMMVRTLRRNDTGPKRIEAKPRKAASSLEELMARQ